MAKTWCIFLQQRKVFDYQGGDFLDILYESDEPTNIENCTLECEHNPSCVAWTYVSSSHPDDDDPRGLAVCRPSHNLQKRTSLDLFAFVQRCSLKWFVPAAHVSSDCVSGVVPSYTLFVNRTLTGSPESQS